MTLIPKNHRYSANIEFNTSTCNLRCVYCPVHTDRGTLDLPYSIMSPETRRRVLDFIRRYPPQHLNLSGAGETTHLPDWIECCAPYLDLGIQTMLYSNFARIFDDQELDALVRFSTIVISIDSVDREILREVRKKVDLQTIYFNITQLRARALARGVPGPKLVFNVVTTDRVLPGSTALVRAAAALGVGKVEFHDYFPTPTASRAGLRSIHALEPNEQKAALDQLDHAFQIGTSLGVEVTLAPTIRRRGHQFLHGKGSEEMPSAGCYMPWHLLTFHGDGTISFCCHALGRFPMPEHATLDDLRNSKEGRQLRELLLRSPGPPAPCVGCESRLPIEQELFQRNIATLVQTGRSIEV